MAKRFGQIGQFERILGTDALKGYVEGIDELPLEDSVDIGTCYLLLNYQKRGDKSYLPGVIYVLHVLDGERVWMDASDLEDGQLDPPTNIWKRLAPDAIVLHWDSPSSKTDPDEPYHNATWAYDVVVRKHYSAPTSVDDGEVVGYSTTRNQYDSNSTGFIHGIDPEDPDYYYLVFSVTKGGVATPAAQAVRTCWTWPEVQEQIRNKRHRICFRIGDIIPLPEHRIFGKLHAQIMAFDYAVRTQLNSSGIYEDSNPDSITFMIVEVLDNLSFDNKELMLAKCNDEAWKANKTYFYKDPDTGVIDVLDLEAHYYSIGAYIPNYDDHGKVLKDNLLEYNASIRYFRDMDTVLPSMTPAAKELCCAPVGGCASWNVSNIRQWLNLSQSGATEEAVEAAFNAYSGKLEEDYPDDWYGERNGWFTAPTGRVHDVAPASISSAHYVDLPRFQDGFINGKSFLATLMNSAIVTIADQYVHMPIREMEDDDTAITGIINDSTNYRGAFKTNERFWLPSFEEIYGRKPKIGTNGLIDTTYTQNTSEGKQFPFFANGANRQSRIKYTADGEQMGWYLRSCDPTAPNRLYYVDPIAATQADNSTAVETTCTAHRITGGDEKKIGPAVCFTVWGGS